MNKEVSAMNPLLSLEQYLYLGNPVKVTSKKERRTNSKMFPHPLSSVVFFGANKKNHNDNKGQLEIIEFLPIVFIFMALL